MLPPGWGMCKVLPTVDLGADDQTDPQVPKGLHGHCVFQARFLLLAKARHTFQRVYSSLAGCGKSFLLLSRCV